MKKRIYKNAFILLATGLAFGLSGAGLASALTINDVGGIDSLLDETKLSNSNPKTEEGWVNGVLSSPVQYFNRFEFGTGPGKINWTSWLAVDGLAGVFAFNLGAYEPGYFLVKTGNVTGDGNSDFLFANNDDLGWAVIDLRIMGFDKIDNITGVSHVSLFNGNEVPEPTTMLLFGTGLAGLAGLRRKTRK